jgi:predicted dehydrogenase
LVPSGFWLLASGFLISFWLLAPGSWLLVALEEVGNVDRVRIAVVGVGALGSHHARVYAGLPEVELTGAVDIAPGRAEAVAREYGCAPFADYRDLLGRVDAVSIATPTTLHAPIGEAFLRAGTHVLVEKPIAATLEEADRLIRAAGETGKILRVGHVERFNPAVQAVREVVRRPRFFEAHRMGVFSPRSLDVDVVLDLMIHDLDIITLLVGAQPVSIQAVGIAILTPRIDMANARLQFADGCVANVTASRVSMEKIRRLRLFHADEYISLDYSLQQAAIFSLDRAALAGSITAGAIAGRTVAPPKVEPLAAELHAFVASVRGEAAAGCTGEEGRSALDLALQVLALAETAQSREFDRK